MGGEANVEVLWRELLRLLEEEVAAMQAAFEEEVKAAGRDGRDRAGLPAWLWRGNREC